LATASAVQHTNKFNPTGETLSTEGDGPMVGGNVRDRIDPQMLGGTYIDTKQFAGGDTSPELFDYRWTGDPAKYPNAGNSADAVIARCPGAKIVRDKDNFDAVKFGVDTVLVAIPKRYTEAAAAQERAELARYESGLEEDESEGAMVRNIDFDRSDRKQLERQARTDSRRNHESGIIGQTSQYLTLEDGVRGEVARLTKRGYSAREAEASIRDSMADYRRGGRANPDEDAQWSRIMSGGKAGLSERTDPAPRAQAGKTIRGADLAGAPSTRDRVRANIKPEGRGK